MINTIEKLFAEGIERRAPVILFPCGALIGSVSNLYNIYISVAIEGGGGENLKTIMFLAHEWILQTFRNLRQNGLRELIIDARINVDEQILRGHRPRNEE